MSILIEIIDKWSLSHRLNTNIHTVCVLKCLLLTHSSLLPIPQYGAPPDRPAPSSHGGQGCCGCHWNSKVGCVQCMFLMCMREASCVCSLFVPKAGHITACLGSCLFELLTDSTGSVATHSPTSVQLLSCVNSDVITAAPPTAVMSWPQPRPRSMLVPWVVCQCSWWHDSWALLTQWAWGDTVTADLPSCLAVLLYIHYN